MRKNLEKTPEIFVEYLYVDFILVCPIFEKRARQRAYLYSVSFLVTIDNFAVDVEDGRMRLRSIRAQYHSKGCVCRIVSIFFIIRMKYDFEIRKHRNTY